jgi:nucleoside phosphorylase
LKAKPVYLDFLNREASRAVGRERRQEVDVDILRTFCLTLPSGFSANIAQMAEYGAEKPQLFEKIMKLISAGIIDATSSAGTMDEFLDDHQQRYSHVPKRYPFYYERSSELEGLRLGTRNEFSMTNRLGQHLLNYETRQFPFDFSRASANDQRDFERGHDALVKKLMSRDDLAITRDLLETPRGGADLAPQQIAATTRIFSALYMKIYADNRSLAICTGIPDFSYREDISGFPSFDYPILRRAIVSLGGQDILRASPIEAIIDAYKSQDHLRFAYYLEGYLDSAYESLRSKINDPGSLSSFRAMFDQFFVRELDNQVPMSSEDLGGFFRQSTMKLLASGNKVAQKDRAFLKKWSDYVPEPTKGLIVITTATDSEDTALFAALEQHGFQRSMTLSTGQGFAQEFCLGLVHRIVHIRTRAGSFGVNSAGGTLPPALNHLNAKFVISAGICFGLQPKKYDYGKQELGDVLIASDIQDYETVRQGETVKQRGEKLPASPGLLTAARLAKDQIDQSKFRVFEGTVLSGQKLVDDAEFAANLRKTFSEAIGGEMEGNALATSSIYEKRDWVLIKGICDWGMNKGDGAHEIAANRACQLAVKAALIVLTSE